MTEIEIVRYLLSKVQDTDFEFRIYSSDGFDGWDTEENVTITAPQLRYLIKEKFLDPQLYEGLEVEEFDLASLLYDISKELSWPDGPPSAKVLSVIPYELSDLEERFDDMDLSDESNVSEIKSWLDGIETGLYTFVFAVESECYSFTSDAEKQFELTRDQVLGIIKGKYGLPGIIDDSIGIIDDDDLNGFADDEDLADDYDNLSYGGESEALDGYLAAWETFVDSILNGDVLHDDALCFTEFLAEGDYERDFSEWIIDLKKDVQ